MAGLPIVAPVPALPCDSESHGLAADPSTGQINVEPSGATTRDSSISLVA